jgi:hypothetical protein
MTTLRYLHPAKPSYCRPHPAYSLIAPDSRTICHVQNGFHINDGLPVYLHEPPKTGYEAATKKREIFNFKIVLNLFCTAKYRTIPHNSALMKETNPYQSLFASFASLLEYPLGSASQS